MIHNVTKKKKIVTEHPNIEEWSRAINNNLPISYTNVPPLGKVVEDTSLHTQSINQSIIV